MTAILRGEEETEEAGLSKVIVEYIYSFINLHPFICFLLHLSILLHFILYIFSLFFSFTSTVDYLYVIYL